MNDKINITKADGSTINADIVCYLENKKTAKRYAYFTLNEIVGAGAASTVKIYVSKIKQDNPTLDTPITEEDWGVLKGYMGDSLKGITNPDVLYVPLSELKNPVSVSERAIAMPTSYDYINKQRGIYAQAIATDSSTTSDASSGNSLEPTPVVTPNAQEPTMTTVEPTPTPVSEPAPTIESQPTPIEPTPVPTPVVEQSEPVPVAPTETIAVQEPTPIVPTEPTPAILEPVPSPLEAPISGASEETGTGAQLTPIDLATIEAKYADMIETINKLKDQELEAAKRYNATLELSLMHKEQHANYVQNEQIKEATIASQEVPTEPTPTVNPVPTIEPQPVPSTPVGMQATPTPVTPEPTPITPITPAPTAAENLETNWFDMPNN